MARVVARFFSDIDTPLLGASPACSAYRLDTNALAATGAMTEIAEGLYFFEFADVANVDYATSCDAGAGAAQPGGRYTDGVIELGKFHEIIMAMAVGSFTETAVSGTVKDFAFTDYDGNALYTLRIEDATGRTRTVG